MKKEQKKKQLRKWLRRKRVRSRIFGSNERPRLNISRSLRFIRVQLIDDTESKTLVYLETKSSMKGTKTEQAKELGLSFGKLALEKGYKKVVFDRGTYIYHGRVAAFAEGAREAGLEF